MNRESRERNSGWVRVRRRGERAESTHLGTGEKSRRDYVETRGRVEQQATKLHWRDREDISSF